MDKTPIKPGWLYGRSQLAEYTGASKRTLSKWIKDGLIPCRRINNKTVLFKISEIDRALESMGDDR